MGGFFNHFLYQNGPKMDPKREPKFRKMRRGRAGPPIFAQWDPKASKMALNEPPKLPKWTPELTKWSFGDAKTHKMEPETAKMKHGRPHGYNFRSIRTLCAWHSFAFAPSTRSNLKEGMLPWWRAQQQTFGGVQIKRRCRTHCWQHEICFAFVEKRPSMERTRRIHPRHNLKPRKPKNPHTHNDRNPTAGWQTKKPIRD